MVDRIGLYQRLPYAGKVAVASLRGWQLRAWRYGPHTERLVHEATARESWTHEEWSGWQEKELASLLDHAARQAPYYRRMWEERRRRGDNASWKVLRNWPVLGKESLRQSPAEFLTDGSSRSRMFHLHTSGSTGTPLNLWVSREDLQRWYALSEARWRRWHGVSRADRWAIIGGQLVTPVESRDPPFWVWNQGLNQLYISSIHIAPWSASAIVEALVRYEVQYLLGYPSALYSLARNALDGGHCLPGMKVVICNAEPLFEFQRLTLEQAFEAPIVNTYGMAEMACAAGECAEGTLHLWPDAGVLELLEEGSATPARAGATGRLICTGLVNRSMPLIRYDVGDRGALGSSDSQCRCGRTLPHLKSLQGRADDVVMTPDGRSVGRLDTVFKGEFPIRAAQIRQEHTASVRILVEPAKGYDASSRVALREAVADRLRPMTIEVEEVEHIPRGPNGKLRGVVSKISRSDPLVEI